MPEYVDRLIGLLTDPAEAVRAQGRALRASLSVPEIGALAREMDRRALEQIRAAQAALMVAEALLEASDLRGVAGDVAAVQRLVGIVGRPLDGRGGADG